MNGDLKKKISKIKLLACDFDGVMTDGRVYINQDGSETIQCSRKDGMGVGMLQKNGISVVVISTEANSVVMKRCEKLKIKCWQRIESTEGKLDILKNYAKEMGLLPEEVAFMGDDVNDIAALKWSGAAFTVADGHQLVKKIADYVTRRKGGDHAVREVCEIILKTKGKKIEY